jgi:hopanoid biosynthesis associated RND transporter like protein HpnN
MESENLNGESGEHGLIESFATRLVDIAHRRAWWFILAYALFTISAVRYTGTHLGINSYIEDMIAEDLPWRQTFMEYREAFPQYVDNLLIVIDGLTPDLARQAQYRLAAEFESDKGGVFESVFLPGAGAFFDQNGLLYLETDELYELSDKIIEMQPVLGILAKNADLTGLARVFRLAADDTPRNSLTGFEKPLFSFSEAFSHSAENQFHPMSWQNLLAVNSSRRSEMRRIILLETRRDFDRFLPGEIAIDRVRELVAELNLDADHGVSVRLTGPVALEYEELQSVRKGSVNIAILALIMVSIVLIFAFRSFQLIAVSLITLITGLIGTAAFAAFAVGDLNLLSISFGVLYIGLGIDFAIHFSMRYRKLIGQGRSQSDALHETAGDVGSSLVFCALTTSVGFFAFYPTDFAGVSELGLISGAGMYISLIASLTLLPALLTVWPPQIDSAPTASTFRWNPVANKGYVRFIRVAALFLGLLALTQINRLEFDSNPMNIRDPKAESVIAYEEMRSDASATPMVLSVLQPSLAAAENSASELSRLPEVGKTMTINGMVPNNQEEKIAVIQDLELMLGSTLDDGSIPATGQDIEARLTTLANLHNSLAKLESSSPVDDTSAIRDFRLAVESFRRKIDPASSEQQAIYLDLLETNLFDGLGPALRDLRTALTADEIDLEGLPADIRSQWIASDGRHRVAIFPSEGLANRDSERQFVDGVRSKDPNATGMPVMEVEAAHLVVTSFQQALTTALVVVFTLLILLMKNWRDPILVMIPILLASLLTVAVMVSSGMLLNFANIIALPLLFGIGVDNGIHIVHRYRVGSPSNENLMATSTARAVYFGTLTTVVSFGSLALSAHYGMATMGKLLTIGMIMTLITTLIVLPTLLPASKAPAAEN